MDVAECFLAIRRLAHSHELADGANQRPHYSIRTLARALTFASDVCATYGLRRSLWEGFVMAFTMLLEQKSNQTVRSLIHANILAKAKNARSAASFVPPAPSQDHVQLGSFWLEAGPLAPQLAEDYVLTASVQDKVVGLARAALTRKSPVLIQGPTSAGKTSAVEYLARRTGHRFVRINNHEHTDIQEYIGSYSSDPDSGRLVFREGLLVSALRRGDWIVLDELNLAPTDVLEALNRLLDDNRELLIPETGEVVKPHPHFMLFATQNPPGLYAGRKVLSRAFRNRFLEVHFDDVPQPELETILTRRCAIAPSYAAKIVAVFVELQRRRQAGRVFDSKQAFVTLRDLFRWGQREAVGYEELAENGYMLIAERARRADDQAVVREVIQDVLNVRLDVDALYQLSSTNRQKLESRLGEDYASAILEQAGQSGLVWTEAMQRLLSLVATALRYDEPILLVGETGTGKTSICEMLAEVFGRRLHTVNCHQNTDTADLLGGQRPLRNRAALQAKAKIECDRVLSQLEGQEVSLDLQAASSKLTSLLASATWNEENCTKEEARTALRCANQSLALFEWHDGPLVEAMRNGDHVLLDEISLADDSVLERLNSVLEPGRTVVLAERGSSTNKNDDTATLRATNGFQVVATMNPGGDYGKKELSPALRNRFTEIWVPHVDARSDLLMILDRQWVGVGADVGEMRPWSAAMLDFTDWFAAEVGGRDAANIGLRDLIAWASFVKSVVAGREMAVEVAFIHGALLCIVDGVGTLPATASMSRDGLERLRVRCHTKLSELVGGALALEEALKPAQISVREQCLSVGPFSVEMVEEASSASSFSFGAQTPATNALRVVRALQIPNKSIMLEGSPGAGKTSLIVALAQASGHALTRINLSDQTELVDLFGADLPVEGGAPGEFSWRDAAFLSAMQRGEWVLLDEMNLASQSVLEGLNSCLDHRGSVYVPELGRSFNKHPSFRIFAAQNPHHQGGGRKGLPKSFLNRFTKVFVQALEPEDIEIIAGHLYPSFDSISLKRMIRFNASLHDETMVRHSFGRAGAPWEFNLRDLLRWLNLLHADLGLNWRGKDPIEHLASLYILRFRTLRDREAAADLFCKIFERDLPLDVAGYRPWPLMTPHRAQFGHTVLQRSQQGSSGNNEDAGDSLGVEREQLPALEALAECVRMAWPAILCGPSQSGKTSLVRYMARLTGNELEELRMSSGTDTLDVLGGFEQIDPLARARRDAHTLLDVVSKMKRTELGRIGRQGFEDVCRAQKTLIGVLKEVSTTDGGTAARLRTTEAVHQVASSLVASTVVSGADKETCSGILAGLASSAEDRGKDAGKFAWVDGPLLRAMKQGKWLLLDDANLCSASVLDRLNSLLEPGGSVVLSERGVGNGSGEGSDQQVPVIRPHADFRIFLTLDPKHGELSRAMRNRGLEICLVEPTSTSTKSEERSFESHMLSQDSELVLARQWAAPLSEEGQGDGAGLVRELAAAHLLSSLSKDALALASRMVQDALPVQLFQEDSVVRSTHALTLKNRFAQEQDNIDALFLSELGPNLSMNPNLVGVLSSDAFGARLSLGVRVLHHSLDLEKVVESAHCKSSTSAKKDHLTVLERSALSSLEGGGAKDPSIGGRGVLSSHDIATFPFIRSVLVASQALLGILTREVTSEVGDQGVASSLLGWMTKLLDLTTFLALSWASNGIFDYSATTVVAQEMDKILSSNLLSGWAASSAPFEQEEVGKRLELLGAKRVLKSGLAMRGIWQAFLPGADASQKQITLDAELSDALSDLQQGLRGADRQRRDVISSAIDVAATLELAIRGGQEEFMVARRQELLEIVTRVKQSLDAIQRGAGTVDESEEDDWLSEGEGLTLSSLLLLWSTVDARDAQAGLQALTDLVKSSKRYTLTSAVALRRASWKSTGTIEVQTTVDIVRGLWKDRINAEQALSGPQDLFRPMLLWTTLRRCLPRRTSLAEVVQRRESLTWLASALGLSLGPSRRQSTRAALQHTFDHLSSCLWYTVEDLHPGVGNLVFVQEGAKTALESLRRVMIDNAASEDTTIASIVSDWTKCAAQVQDPSPSLVQLGASMVRFASSMIHLYVPNVAIDPLAVQRTKEAMVEHTLNRINIERKLLQQRAELITGSIAPSTVWTRALDQRALEATSGREEKRGKVVINREPAPLDVLARLHGEMKSFVDQVLEKGKLMDLVDRLSSEEAAEGDSDDHLRLIARLANLQASISSLLDRFRTIYASLHDLTQPLSLCLSLMQLGLGALVQHARCSKRSTMASKNADVVDKLVRFPTVDASGRFSNLIEVPLRLRADSRLGSLAVPTLLTKLAAIEHERQHGVPAPVHFAERVSRTYDQLAHLWSLDRQRESKEEQEGKSLYRSQKIDVEVEDDEVLQEKEFAMLFPEYEDVMALRASTATTSNGKEAKAKDFFSPESVVKLYRLHMALFTEAHEDDVQRFAKWRVDVVNRLMGLYYQETDESLDGVSKAFQLDVIASRLPSQQNQPDSERDFYRDTASSDQVARMLGVVNSMRSRLEGLIDQYPDQMVLSHLRDRCDAILSLDAGSCPVARLLSALEQLLLHTEDWQAFASSQTSLVDQRSLVSGLIIEWRRLELSSWAKLLQRHHDEVIDADGEKYWFHLFEAAIRAPCQGTAAEDEEHIAKLVALLDEYVRTANLGQWQARLDLLASFARYARLLSTQFVQLDPIAKVLFNVVAFYGQHSEGVQAHLDRRRAVIEKEIADYVKLASWKDVNVFALQQSAKQTHRKLHKCVRKFRDVLRLPMDPILAELGEASIKTKGLDVVGAASSGDSVDISTESGVVSFKAGPQPWQGAQQTMSAHLLDLSTTWKRLESLTRRDLGMTILQQPQQTSSGLSSLASQILERSEALRKQTPATWTEDTAKAIKSLETRKRKAWSDLLKELRRIGLSSAIQQNHEKINEPAWVYSRSATEGALKNGEEDEEVEKRYFGLLNLVPRLRGNITNAERSPDVLVTDLQRAQGFVEHAATLTVDTRQRSMEMRKPLASLQAFSSRIAVLAGGPIGCGVGSQQARLQAIEELTDALHKTLAGLEETLQRILGQSRLLSSSNIDIFASELQRRAEAVRECAQGVAALSKSFRDSGLVVVTHDEGALIERCAGEMRATLETLSAAPHHLTIWTGELRQFLDGQTDVVERSKSIFSSSREGDERKEQDEHEAGKKSDRIISSILVVVQGLTKLECPEEQEDELQDKAVPAQQRQLAKVESLLRLDELMREVAEFSSLCNGISSSSGGDVVRDAMQRLAPFARRYAEIVHAHLEAARRFICALLKLAHVVCVLVVNLAKRGFCRPPPKEEEQTEKGGGDGQEALEDDDGTGLGDGSGMKDITDQLGEDEEMEELQKDEDKDEQEQDEGDKNKEKGAKEMEQDFDGELESVEGEDEAEEDGEREEQEDGEMDEAVGEVDPLDPGAVDEKTWGGEDEEEKEDQDTKDETDKDLGGKDADDGGQEQKKKDGKKGKSQKDQANEGAGERGEEDGEDAKDDVAEDQDDIAEGKQADEGDDGEKQEGEEQDQEQDEEADGDDPDRMGRQVDQEATQGENLDLPEDLNIDGGGDEEEEGKEGQDEFSDLGDDDEQEGGPDQDEKKPDEGGIEVDDFPEDGEEKEKLDKVDDNNGQEDGQDEDMADGEVPHDKGEEAMDDEEEDGDDDDEEPQGQQQGQQGQQQQPQSQSGQDNSGDAAPAPDAGDVGQEDNSADQQQQSTRGAQGRMTVPMEDSSSASQGAQRGGQSSSQPQQPPPSTDEPAQGEEPSAAEEGAEGQEDGEGQDASQDPNPVRSLGDALRDFRRDLDAIEERMAKEEGAEEEGGMPEDSAATAFEHVDDQDQDADMQQALGAAKEDEARNLDGIVGGDEDEEKLDKPPMGDGDETIEAREEREALPLDDVTAADDDEESGDEELAAIDGEREEDTNNPLPEEERQQIEQSLEDQLAALSAKDDENDDGGEASEEKRQKFDELWKTYASLTSDLSLQLCEQLRLILAPTLATRFAGDYKTGKRLNMRKIVPFIASDFAKDKIWLRRSRPAKREYQVLLSIDDSKSMREGTGKRVRLAYQTLVLLKGAMDRLEVGEIAIAKFGSKMELLRGFDSSTGAAEGGDGRILEKLTFEQRGTDVLNLVEDSLAFLSRSREKTSSMSGKDLWQLQLIVSDGICQNHDKLRSLLRRAHEEKVMLVFVIVDCLHSDGDERAGQQQQQQQSIVDLSSVSYHTNPATASSRSKWIGISTASPLSTLSSSATSRHSQMSSPQR
ncbi:hypothetical protein L7F22_032381 [Adiantum nelumboides]|nr:hypothetical protein [Adiantum nelumboides]